MQRIAIVILLAATFLCGGCSTITQSENQTLALTATYANKPVEAACELKNDKGSWEAKALSNVSVHKSSEDINVSCKREGMPDGLATGVSRAAGSMFGNIIFGGGIGAIIDHTKGTGYNYPSQISVKMGESVVFDRRNEQSPEVMEANADSSATGNGAAASPASAASTVGEQPAVAAATAQPVSAVTPVAAPAQNRQ